MKPAVSVIVPVYRVEEFLPRCMDSLLGQTLERIEIILVDDGSPDGCPAMCDGYRETDPRVRVIHKRNEGLGFARNSGMEIAQGEYIAFVDSDDYVERDMLACMYEAAQKYDADFVRADHFRETRDGRVLNAASVPPMREGLYEQEELRRTLLYPQFGLLPQDGGEKYVSCSVCWALFRREIIQNRGIRFDSERDMISEDLLLNLAYLMTCCRAYVINRKVYHYIVNDRSLTRSYLPNRFQREIVFFHEAEKRLREAGIYGECEMRLRRHLLDRLRRCVKGELCGNPQPSAGRENARKMMNAPEVLEVLADYPLARMPLKYRAVNTLIKYRCVRVLYRLREKL